VAWFQIKHRLPATGVVDGATITLLRLRTHGTTAAPARTSPTDAAPVPAPHVAPAAPRSAPESVPQLPRHVQPAPTARPEPARNESAPSTLVTLVALFLALFTAAVLAQWIRVQPRLPDRTQFVAILQKPMALAARIVSARRALARPQARRAPARQPAARRGRPVGAVAVQSDGSGRRVIGYAVGRDDRDIARQMRAMERLCGERGWTMAALVKERDKRRSRRRPGLAHVLGQVAAGSVGELVVGRLHSLARSPSELATLLEWCSTRGVGIIALDVGLDTTTADGRIAARCLGAVARPAQPASGTRRGNRNGSPRLTGVR